MWGETLTTSVVLIVAYYGKTAAMSISEGAEWVRVEGNHQKTSDQGFTILPQLLRQMDYHLLSFSSS